MITIFLILHSNSISSESLGFTSSPFLMKKKTRALQTQHFSWASPLNTEHIHDTQREFLAEKKNSPLSDVYDSRFRSQKNHIVDFAVRTFNRAESKGRTWSHKRQRRSRNVRLLYFPFRLLAGLFSAISCCISIQTRLFHINAPSMLNRGGFSRVSPLVYCPRTDCLVKGFTT